jgi:hypothetical protein
VKYFPHRNLILCYNNLMPNKVYEHSAYYYAYHYGWTHSEARTYAGRYLDQHTYRPRMRKRPDGEWHTKDWFKWRNSSKELDSTFDPLLLAILAAADIGIAMRDTVSKIANPAKRSQMKQELMRDLRQVRRPLYYRQEVERRRQFAKERRKIHRRRTTASMPTPEEVLTPWDHRKSSREAMIHLGGMLHDLECYVDNCLKFDEAGNVIGRNGGIRGWIAENVPHLLPKYKTLMRYKALAVRVRQVAGIKDPTPTSKLLAKPCYEAVKTILAEKSPIFARVFAALEHMLSLKELMHDVSKSVEINAADLRGTRRRRVQRQ